MSEKEFGDIKFHISLNFVLPMEMGPRTDVNLFTHHPVALEVYQTLLHLHFIQNSAILLSPIITLFVPSFGEMFHSSFGVYLPLLQ